MSLRISRGRLLALTAAAAASLALPACGSQGASTPSGATGATGTSGSTAAPPKLSASLESQRLPQPLSGESVAASDHHLLVIGGLDASDSSLQSILSFDLSSGRIDPAGSLAEPLHDAAAVALPRGVFVFGGGSTSSISTVEELAPTATARPISNLPTPRSDLSATTMGNRAYVLGGYDGATLSRPVLSTGDGRRFSSIAALRIPVRYTAVATAGSRILVFGGETAAGTPTDAIQAVDPLHGTTHIAGRLPTPVDHASAVTLGGAAYVLGGEADGRPTDRMWRFDPATGRVQPAGTLPQPVADAAAATIDDTAYLVGGVGATDRPLDTIISVRYP
ncbi:MAG TPA: hypothetical protein VKG89_03015 [Solirubrobacterales bacterium]|nr:hypothetical protein [Solirubrobacterales bacterium]